MIKVTAENLNGMVVIIATGELTGDSETFYSFVIDQVSNSGKDFVVLDLSAVGNVDHKGLEQISRIHHKLEDLNLRSCWVFISRRVLQMLESVGLDQVLTHCDSLLDAYQKYSKNTQ